MDPGDWQQAVIEFASRHGAEQVAATHLRPALAAAQAGGLITGWFFIRKFPCWRVRYLPVASGARQHLAGRLDGLAADGRIIAWNEGIYEPEILAFGGTAAMDAAHDLFCADSRHILDYLALAGAAAPGELRAGRREVAVLLSSVLMRGAHQDWYEQGDVWAKVTRHRPAQHAALGPQRLSVLKTATWRLMTADASPGITLGDDGPLAPLADWPGAFDRAGRQLADLARRGALERGLRAVLAHHVIFFLNRLGLTYPEQATLAALAKEVVMTEPNDGAPGSGTGTGPVNVTRMDTGTADDTAAAAERLRHALASQLHDRGTVRTKRVEGALRAVPRHLFVPAAPLLQAYADQPVYTKHDPAGAPVSAASQPAIVAMMLEQLQTMPGHRVLEIGAGTGYNAALLAHLAGEHGEVTTIDVDPDIVDTARKALTAAGFGAVRVILGDGALGYPHGAPYDRIIATVGAWDLPPGWLEQLNPGGRLVVPLRLRGSVSRSVVFERDGGHWRGLSSQMCGFMPLRGGIADDPRRIVPLTPDGTVTLQAHQDQNVDPAALVGILGRPRIDAWTGVLFAAPESVEWLDLWLACTLDNALCRMPVQRPAIDSGLVRPAFGWGAMATTSEGNLAYLTLRPAPKASDGTSMNEVGVVAHGPESDELARQVAEQIRTWDQKYRSRTAQIHVQSANAPEPITGQFTFRTPRNRLVISWE
jgi:protein-L-isoaspartate(D-aspartate) O-methyltransferase